MALIWRVILALIFRCLQKNNFFMEKWFRLAVLLVYMFLQEAKTEDGFMNLAKISCNGQITVPVEIRRALKVTYGDKIICVRTANGEIFLKNLERNGMDNVQRVARQKPT